MWATASVFWVSAKVTIQWSVVPSPVGSRGDGEPEEGAQVCWITTRRSGFDVLRSGIRCRMDPNDQGPIMSKRHSPPGWKSKAWKRLVKLQRPTIGQAFGVADGLEEVAGEAAKWRVVLRRWSWPCVSPRVDGLRMGYARPLWRLERWLVGAEVVPSRASGRCDRTSGVPDPAGGIACGATIIPATQAEVEGARATASVRIKGFDSDPFQKHGAGTSLRHLEGSPIRTLQSSLMGDGGFGEADCSMGAGCLLKRNPAFEMNRDLPSAAWAWVTGRVT